MIELLCLTTFSLCDFSHNPTALNQQFEFLSDLMDDIDGDHSSHFQEYLTVTEFEDEGVSGSFVIMLSLVHVSMGVT